MALRKSKKRNGEIQFGREEIYNNMHSLSSCPYLAKTIARNQIIYLNDEWPQGKNHCISWTAKPNQRQKLDLKIKSLKNNNNK